MKKFSLLAAVMAISVTGCNLIPLPSCFNRGDSCPAMGCSAEMSYEGCSDCAPSSSYGVPSFPYSEAPVASPSSNPLPAPGTFPAQP